MRKGDRLEHVEFADTFIFTSEMGDKYADPDNLKRLWGALMNAAKVPRVHPYDIRHLRASVAIWDGMDPKMLAERLGHLRASSALDRYTHIFDPQRAQGAVFLNNWLSKERGEPN